MNTYEITTTHGVLNVKGDEFEHATDPVTGDDYGYQVTKDGGLVAQVAPGAFISVTVRAKPEPPRVDIPTLDAQKLAQIVWDAAKDARLNTL